MEGMVITMVLAYFLNTILISMYFDPKIWIKYSTHEKIQFFILLVGTWVLISSVICKGKQSFNPPSTPSWLTFVHLPLFLPPPLPSLPQFAHNHTQQPDHEPLPSIEGCGLDYQHLCSLTSEDAAPAAPPLSQGMWAVQTRSLEEPGKDKG